MKKTIAEIVQDYTGGKTGLEETNQALREAEAGFCLKPGRNALTEEELRATTIGCYPDMANGFGLLDTGTGTLDKVRVERGQLVACDCGAMPALVTLAGRTYEVRGRVLAERGAA